MIDAELLKAREKAVKGDSGDGGRSDSEGVKGGKPYVRPWDRGKGTCYEHVYMRTCLYLQKCMYYVVIEQPLLWESNLYKIRTTHFNF